MAQLTGVIYTGACFPRVERVMINISTNDCVGNTVPCSIVADYTKLLSVTTVSFPKAEVATVAIPPQGKCRTNETITKTI